MIRYLYYPRTIEKQLTALRRSGKKGAWAIAQYEILFNSIRQGQLLSESVYAKRTKHGEYRISNCVKYDLGNGYRLITIRVGENLFIPFVGGHDESDKWLDRRKNDEYSPEDPLYICEKIIPVDETASNVSRDIVDQQHANTTEHDLYEEQLCERVDDSILREVFGSLYRK